MLSEKNSTLDCFGSSEQPVGTRAIVLWWESPFSYCSLQNWSQSPVANWSLFLGNAVEGWGGSLVGGVLACLWGQAPALDEADVVQHDCNPSCQKVEIGWTKFKTILSYIASQDYMRFYSLKKQNKTRQKLKTTKAILICHILAPKKLKQGAHEIKAGVGLYKELKACTNWDPVLENKTTKNLTLWRVHSKQ